MGMSPQSVRTVLSPTLLYEFIYCLRGTFYAEGYDKNVITCDTCCRGAQIRGARATKFYILVYDNFILHNLHNRK
jgi:hypothetical protein